MIKLAVVTKILQGTRMALAGVRLLRDPNQLGEAFVLADTIGQVSTDAVQRMADGFRRDPRGARALVERTRLRLPPVEELSEMPAGSLGRAFADYLARNRIDPSDLPSRPSPDECAFVMAHLYETHDLWHTVTGFETDVAGELGLQAFYVAQTEGKLGLLLLSIGMLEAAGKGFEDRQARLDAVARGWLLGKRARPLFGLPWAERWGQPIAELRAELGLALDDVDRTVAVSVDTAATAAGAVLRSAA
ncbi:MAG: hypothetical protein EOO75_06180 [Myxococcales bacterium]|nr:MAG: hypothetical protein EOO75_06180 [Myxococcales bacterium]